MGRLTEANYHSRRAKLGSHLAAANAAFLNAAHDLEVGTGDSEAVTAAQARINDIETRLVGLDAARERAVATERDERAAEVEQARKASAEALASLLDRRLIASGKIAKAVDDMIAAWAEKTEIERQVTGIVNSAMALGVNFVTGGNYGGSNSGNVGSLAMVNQALKNDFAGSYAAAKFARVGWDFSGDWASASYSLGPDGDLPRLCEQSNHTVLAQVSRTNPEVRAIYLAQGKK